MAITALVETQIRAQVDAMSAYMRDLSVLTAGKTSLWDLMDAAALLTM